MESTYALPRVERRARSLDTFLVPLAIMLVALVPRVLNLGVFATMDEVNFWFARSEAFLNALRTGNFAATAITDHPGVTTMWLGATSIVLRDTLAAWGLLPPMTPQLLVGLFELPISIVHGIAVGVGYWLLRGIVPRPVALLGCLLWALDPFVIAYSRVLHVDGPAATFMTLSLFAACRYWFHGARRSDLIISGICAGLGMVSKSPALILFPTMAVIAFASARVGRKGTDYRTLVGSFAAWSLITVVAAVVTWPALWSNPFAAYEQIRIGYTAEGTQPHQLGNFFLGRSDPAPGFLFYPVAIALRLTPITLVGLLVLPWAWRRVQSPESRRSLAAMTWFVLLFTFAMSLFAKKFNRYIVPAFPALDLLAALGLLWLGAVIATTLGKRIRRTGFVQPLLSGVLVLLAAANVAWWHPYHIAAYNQLLGGAQAGAWAFKTGWGEGMNLAADWLNEQPNITGVLTVTTLKTGLQTYLRPGAQSTSPPVGPLPPQSGYVAVYINDAQMGYYPPPFEQFFGKVEPIKVITIHGVEYVWIYEAPPTVDQTIEARFGSEATLYGIIRPQNPKAGTTLDWTLAWQPHAAPPEGTMLFAHLIGPDNKRYAQIDLPFVNSPFDPQRYRELHIPLAVPADAPAGRYRLIFGLYTPDGQRLPLQGGTASDPAIDGPNALVLDEFDLAGQ